MYAVILPLQTYSWALAPQYNEFNGGNLSSVPTHPQAAAQSGHFWHGPSTCLLSPQPALHHGELAPQAPKANLIHYH